MGCEDRRNRPARLGAANLRWVCRRAGRPAGVRGSIAPFYRGGLADVAIVRAHVPLPETADELCAVAKSMAAAESNVYLGAKATEQTVKNLSADGTLARARVIHFATHGLLAGETEMLTSSRVETALLLTPPDQATETDDGLLTASEISQLKLDADWVVLSACNTAAGESDKRQARLRVAVRARARVFLCRSARLVGLALGRQFPCDCSADHRRVPGNGSGPSRTR